MTNENNYLTNLIIFDNTIISLWMEATF